MTVCFKKENNIILCLIILAYAAISQLSYSVDTTNR